MPIDTAKLSNWIQFALLVVTILLAALHGEGQIASMRQQLTDEHNARLEMLAHLDHIEARIDAMTRQR